VEVDYDTGQPNGGNGGGPPPPWWEAVKGTAHGSTLVLVLWLAMQVGQLNAQLSALTDKVSRLTEHVYELRERVRDLERPRGGDSRVKVRPGDGD
jgi:hypothetical protein